MVDKMLNLTIKKIWFDMIASGEKKEDYRELKDYWWSRLTELIGNEQPYRKFDLIVFRNGYNKNSPVMTAECLGITAGIGKIEWGAPSTVCLIIHIGKVIMIHHGN